MGEKKEMTLMVRIRANGSEAVRELKKMNNFVDSWSASIKKSFDKNIGAGFRDIGAIGGIVFAPLRIASTAAMGLAGGLMAVGTAAIYAAEEEEKLRARLAAVAGSSEQGKHAIEQLNTIARHSGFKTDDLAEAAIVMKQYGITGQRQLIAVAKAARVAGVDVQTLALQTMALQARGLKRFGIEMEEGKDNPVLKFRDNAGKVLTIATKTADEARRKLIEVFALKFGVDIKPTTLSAFIQMLKNNLTQALERIGEYLLPAAKRFIDYISGGLATAIEKGKLDEWGKKIGEWFQGAVAGLIAGIKTAAKLWDALMADPRNFADVLSWALEDAMNIAAFAFVAYLAAMTDVFAGIGKVIAGGLFNALSSNPIFKNLPGMDTLMNKAASASLDSMSRDGMLNVRRRFMGKDKYFRGDMTDEQIRSDLKFQLGANVNMRDELASGLGENWMEDGFKQLKEKIPEVGKTVADYARMRLEGLNTDVTSAVGFDPKKYYEKEKAQELAAMQEGENYGKERVTAQFTKYYTPDNSKPWIRYPLTQESSFVADEGNFQRGQKTPNGGIVINIQNLNAISNDAGRATRDVINAATRGAPIPAAAN